MIVCEARRRRGATRGIVSGSDPYGLTARTHGRGRASLRRGGIRPARRAGPVAGLRPSRLPRLAPSRPESSTRSTPGRDSGISPRAAGSARPAGSRSTAGSSWTRQAGPALLERCENCRLGLAAGLTRTTLRTSCWPRRGASRTGAWSWRSPTATASPRGSEASNWAALEPGRGLYPTPEALRHLAEKAGLALRPAPFAAAAPRADVDVADDRQRVHLQRELRAEGPRRETCSRRARPSDSSTALTCSRPCWRPRSSCSSRSRWS